MAAPTFPGGFHITREWRRLLLLGAVCHALYALCLVGVYFVRPVSLHIDRDALSFADHAPAKRVVVFVADDWQADAFFARRQRLDMPFLRDVVEHRGSWGVAHASATSSELPRHAMLMSGTASSTKHSVLNTSRQSWILGSPHLVSVAHDDASSQHASVKQVSTRQRASTAAKTGLLQGFLSTIFGSTASSPKQSPAPSASPANTTSTTNATTVRKIVKIVPASSFFSVLVDKLGAVAPFFGGRAPHIDQRLVPTLHTPRTKTNTSMALVPVNISKTLNASSVFHVQTVMSSLRDDIQVVSIADRNKPKRSVKKATKSKKPATKTKASTTRARPTKQTAPTKKLEPKRKPQSVPAEDESCFAKMQDLLYDEPEGLDRDGSIFFCPFDLQHSRSPRERSAHVDHLVSVTVSAIERYYQHDGATAYVFTSSRATNTNAKDDSLRTPLVAWGAGVQHPTRPPKPSTKPSKSEQKPKPKPTTFQYELPTHSQDVIRSRLEAQHRQENAAFSTWGLTRQPRKDVLQGDIAPLLSALIGVPTPRDSVGVLPYAYLSQNRYRALAVLSNARELLRHATRTMREKQQRSLFVFRPYAPFRSDAPTLIAQLEVAWANEELELVEDLSQDLIALCLETIAYFERHDLAFMLSFLIAACLAWVGVLAIALASSSFVNSGLMGSMETWLAVFVVANAAFLALEHAPLTFFLFVGCTFVAGHLVWRHADSLKTGSRLCWVAVLGIAASLELVVFRWQHRWVFSLLFALFMVWPLLERRFLTRMVGAGCLAVSLVAYVSTEHGNDALLVELTGFALVVFAVSMFSRSFNISLAPWVLASVTSLGLLHATMHFLSSQVAPPASFTLIASILSLVPVATVVMEVSSPNVGSSSVTKALHAHLLQVAVALAPTPVYLLLSFPFEAVVVVALLGLLVAMLENIRTRVMPTSSKVQLKKALSDMSLPVAVAAS